MLPEGQAPGYVWRTAGITRLEERNGGVYLEMISLSRGIPVAFSCLITPLTEKLPRTILFGILNDTGNAMRQATGKVNIENQISDSGDSK
jgi:hypothetical protein